MNSLTHSFQEGDRVLVRTLKECSPNGEMRIAFERGEILEVTRAAKTNIQCHTPLFNELAHQVGEPPISWNYDPSALVHASELALNEKRKAKEMSDQDYLDALTHVKKAQ